MIVSIGEILCDLIGCKNDNSMHFDVTVGGAPFNVASNLAYLGSNSLFYGVVGKDAFGEFIINQLSKNEKMEKLVKMRDDSNTTLAMFIKSEDGEGDFEFIRNHGSDYLFDSCELEKILKLKPKIIHFGSLFLSNQDTYLLFNDYVKRVKDTNALTSFDVNYRDDIFVDRKEAKKRYLKFISKMDIVKFAEKEIRFLAGTDNLDEAIKYFSFLKVFFVTLGKKGSLCVYKNKTYFVPSESGVTIIDTIGAGDSFYSGVLHLLENKDLDELSESDIEDILSFGNKCGAKTVSHIGAIGAYKSIEDVME